MQDQNNISSVNVKNKTTDIVESLKDRTSSPCPFEVRR